MRTMSTSRASLRCWKPSSRTEVLDSPGGERGATSEAVGTNAECDTISKARLQELHFVAR